MRARPGVVPVVLAAVLFAASPVLAESAADKATARELATEGIELYKKEKYSEALDRMKRAEQLFDAPVHLLYIARSQEKLGQLVEAGENYRLLARKTLPDGSPDAWVSAVADGQKELDALEPRIPKVRITVEPADVKEPSLSIDGAPVSAAVLGVPRAVNPGKHVIAVSAPGMKTASAEVDLEAGKQLDVPLELVPGEGGPAVVPPPPAADATGTAAGKEEPGPVGFLIRLRLGAAFPGGTMLNTLGGNIEMSDAFKSGGGGELTFGLRIAKYFTPVLFFTSGAFDPGDGIFEQGKITDPKMTSGGLGFMVGSAPRKLGGFGEIGFAASSYSADLGAGSAKCNVTMKGGELRLGGGGVFPVASWFELTPFVMLSGGQFTSYDVDGSCSLRGVPLEGRSIPSDDRRTHSLVFVGLGGDFIFGADLR